MKYLIPILILTFIIACSSSDEQISTEEEIKEKEKVVEVLKAYNNAYQKKNFSEMVRYLANDLTFFGSDSGETVKSLTEFKIAIEKQWEDIDSMRFGEMSDIYILMDSRGRIASVIYGVPLQIWSGGKNVSLFLRVARTLKKEGGNWVIASGITGITRASKSVKELLDETSNQ
ncbi:MAG: nuclear transport factor 2 family protein [Candidatus Kapaibacteriota bacterium]